MSIKNIILDFGGVILNLSIPKTISAFNALSPVPFEQIYTQSAQVELFNRFDKGEISETDFFGQLSTQIAYSGNVDDLRAAWNAMLLDLPEHRLKLLLDLKKRYRTFLLSNTCEPHILAFETEMKRVHGLDNLEPYFEKVYYSCRMGLRKPDKEIFEYVLKQHGLLAEETVFIDDSLQHVKGAAEAGIEAHLLEKGQEVGDLLRDLKLL